MQEAGRILLMPKGDYAAGTSYEMLDLVNHGGASWVCKKDCTGQEPSDSNTEFWQRFGTAVDLSNYLQKSGGTIDGNVNVLSDEEVVRNVRVGNALRTLDIGVNTVGGGYINDVTNNEPLCEFLADGRKFFHGTATGNLPLNNSIVPTVSTSYSTVTKFNSNGFDYAWLDLNIDGTNAGAFGYSKNKKPHVWINSAPKELLHTGNKPTGTYTGNGSATARQISTGGIGSAMLVVGGGHSMIVLPNGAFGVSKTGTAVNLINEENGIYFVNGICYMATASDFVNKSGTVYTYWVL